MPLFLQIFDKHLLVHYPCKFASVQNTDVSQPKLYKAFVNQIKFTAHIYRKRSRVNKWCEICLIDDVALFAFAIREVFLWRHEAVIDFFIVEIVKSKFQIG